jgi:hypothetical protein
MITDQTARELIEAAKRAQHALAMLVSPNVVTNTSVPSAYAACAGAEFALRTALTRVQKEIDG